MASTISAKWRNSRIPCMLSAPEIPATEPCPAQASCTVLPFDHTSPNSCQDHSSVIDSSLIQQSVQNSAVDLEWKFRPRFGGVGPLQTWPTGAKHPSHLPSLFDTEAAKLKTRCAIGVIGPASTSEEVSLLLIDGFPNSIRHLDNKHSVDGSSRHQELHHD